MTSHTAGRRILTVTQVVQPRPQVHSVKKQQLTIDLATKPHVLT